MQIPIAKHIFCIVYFGTSYRHFKNTWQPPWRLLQNAYFKIRLPCAHVNTSKCAMQARNFSLQWRHPTGLWKFEEAPVRRRQRLSDLGKRNELFGARGDRGKSRVLSSRGIADASRGAFRYTFLTLQPIYQTYKNSPHVRHINSRAAEENGQQDFSRIFAKRLIFQPQNAKIKAYKQRLLVKLSWASKWHTIFSGSLLGYTPFKCAAGSVTNLHLYPA